MKNKEVVEDFIRGRWIDSKGSNLFSEGNILYSYGRHFPIAVRLKDCWVVNNRTYSPTTSAHQGHFTRALGFKNLKDMINNPDNEILLMDIDGLKYIIDNHFKSKSEIMFDNL